MIIYITTPQGRIVYLDGVSGCEVLSSEEEKEYVYVTTKINGVRSTSKYYVPPHEAFEIRTYSDNGTQLAAHRITRA